MKDQLYNGVDNTLEGDPRQHSGASLIDVQSMQKQLKKYKKLERQWNQQREDLLKHNETLQKQMNRLKALNSSLMKKMKHKRTSSEQHTFIFNQTNISSIYPMVMLQSSNWSYKAHIRSHLDSVRALFWHGDLLISGSDDGLMKIWQKDQPKIIVRQHLAPIYSICGSSRNQNNFFFTAGAEGVVRMWNTNLLVSNKPGALIEQGQYNSDCVWDMAFNQSKSLLLTSSADGTCRLIHVDSYNVQQLKQQYLYKNKQKTRFDIEKQSEIFMKQGKSFSIKSSIPTSIDWFGNTKFICGYANNNKIAVYDVEMGTQPKQYVFTAKETSAQTNRLLYSEKHKMIISGHEDRCLRFFDPNSSKLIKTITGHSDAVTGVLARIQTYEILSCGHDGSVRVWDLRKYRCIHDIPMHMKKYDQGALCMTQRSQQFMIAVGGADGHIKLLSPQH